MFKYVRCIDAEGCDELVLGKKYRVMAHLEDGALYVIRNEGRKGDEAYRKERFEVVVVAAQESTGCRHRINYRLGSPEIREAWFAYKRAERSIPLSVSSFVAGWNAAKEVKHEG